MNYYEVLGVTPRSEPEVIDAVYRALMKKYHPDRMAGDSRQATQRAMLLNEAYATLRDPRKREEYDRHTIRLADWSGEDRRRQARDTIYMGGTTVRPSNRRLLLFAMLAGLVGVGGAALWYNGGEPMAAQALAEVTNAAKINEPDIDSPPIRADGKHRVVCIENRSNEVLNYALWWGNRRQSAQVKPGFYVVHSSVYDVEPTVELVRAGPSPSHSARFAIESGIDWQDDQECFPRYTFAYRGVDHSGPLALLRNSPNS